MYTLYNDQESMVAHGEFAHIEVLNYCPHIMGKKMLNVCIAHGLGLDSKHSAFYELCISFWSLNIYQCHLL
jgi:hypothetical protein